ncbi:hypothetical protein ACLKA7_000846 [Drosophila subpalustris]
MERYTPQERGIIVSIFLRNNSSVVLAQREFCRRFPGRPTPTAQTLRRLATNLEENGTTRDVAKSGRPRSARSAENVCAVHAGGVIGPFFFESAAGQTTTVDGARYRAMLTEFFLPELGELGLVDNRTEQQLTLHEPQPTF